MKYEALSKIYYKRSGEYEEEYVSRFNSPSAQRLPMIIHGYPAFYINCPEISCLISRIYESSQSIERMARTLPGVAGNSFIRDCLLREVVMTNELEGVRSTKREVGDILDGIERSGERGRRLAGMVKKYARLTLPADEETPKTCEDIRQLYDELVLDEIEDEDRPDGELFRNGPVSVMSAAGKEKHRGVSPPEANIRAEMERALSAAADEELPPLVRIALLHYLIGYIHPFYDGNGRLDRFISSCLLKQHLGIFAALGLSAAIKNNRSLYYGGFDMANDEKNRGDLTPFVISFLELIHRGESETYDRLEHSRDELEFYESSIGRLDIDGDTATIIFILVQDKLFDSEPLDLEKLCRVSDLKRGTVLRLLKRLDASHPGVAAYGKRGHRKTYTADLARLEKYGKEAARP